MTLNALLYIFEAKNICKKKVSHWQQTPLKHYILPLLFGLNSIYLIMNIHIDIHTMLCETGSGSKHKAYIEAISCNSVFNTIFK